MAVSDFFINCEPELRRRNLQAGLQYGTRFIDLPHDDFNPIDVPHLTNRSDLPQVIIIDTLTCNKDRTPGNLLMTFEDPARKNKACEFVLIDHTEAFGGGSWNEHTLKSLVNSDAIFVDAVNFNHVPAQMDAFDPFLLSLEALTPEQIKTAINAVPSDWKLPLADAVALADFLITRKDKVRGIVAKYVSA